MFGLILGIGPAHAAVVACTTLVVPPPPIHATFTPLLWTLMEVTPKNDAEFVGSVPAKNSCRLDTPSPSGIHVRRCKGIAAIAKVLHYCHCCQIDRGVTLTFVNVPVLSVPLLPDVTAMPGYQDSCASIR